MELIWVLIGAQERICKLTICVQFLTDSAQMQSVAAYQEPFYGHPQSGHSGCQMVFVPAGTDSVGLHMRLLHPVQARSTV